MILQESVCNREGGYLPWKMGEGHLPWMGVPTLDRPGCRGTCLG